MPPLSLLIKPVSSACNLNCVYCLYGNNSRRSPSANFGLMSMETMEAVVSMAFDYAEEQVCFTFCGGEPALWGTEAFRAFAGYVNMYNQNKLRVFYSINTNGTLIGEDLADFFAANNFHVQLSLDGYKEINDLNRIDIKGGGTFNSVMSAIDLLRHRDVSFGVSCVVNRLTAKYADKIFTFFKKTGVCAFEFIPCLDKSPDKRGKNFYSLTPELYENFLKVLFDKWYDDLLKTGGVSIRHFDNWVSMMFGYPADACHINGVCALSPVIEADGGVYPCRHFVDEDWRLGSILESDLKLLIESEKAATFLRQSFEINEQCNRCKFFKVCRGGCRRDREPLTDGGLSVNYYCEAYRRFFTYASERLRRIAVLLNTNKFI